MSESYIDAANTPAPVKPEGAPDFVPLLQLPRRRRAEVIRLVKGLVKKQKELGLSESPDAENIELTDDEQQERNLDRAAAMFELLAEFEDLLRAVARDPEHFAAWIENANDADLSAAAGWYMRTFQTGEA